MLTFDNPFWKFSISVYAVPAVSAECLDLQRRFDIDVNQLLFCAWLGSAHNIILSEGNLEAIEASVAVWHNSVVRPLRAARQNLKALPAMAKPEVAALRKDIANHELRAEEIEQAMLFALSDSLAKSAEPASAADAVHLNVNAFLERKAPPGLKPPRPDHLIAQAIGYKA